MQKIAKNIAIWLIVAFLLVALLNLFQSSTNHGSQPAMAYSDFIDEVDKGQVKEVQVNGALLTGVLTDGRSFTTYAIEDPTLATRLLTKKVVVKSVPADANPPNLINIIVSWLPLLIICLVLYAVMRKGQRDGGTLSRETQARIDQLEAQVRKLTVLLEHQGDPANPPNSVDGRTVDKKS